MYDEVPEEVVLEVWHRANGLCECRDSKHGHGHSCDLPLTW
jgi:hypothetical protein